MSIVLSFSALHCSSLASENDSTGQPLSYTLKENKDKEKEEEEEEEEKDEAPQEIEESLETDLCRLWDASMNTVRPP